ncbi:MAG: hypothetical protein NTW17_00710 [Candidatus Pacearchaeota archaeon]|nr:hypothetical protein [Candidatus Pacearchaeota archaeon]
MENSLIQRIKKSDVCQELARAGRVLRYSKKHLGRIVGASALLGLSACCDPNKPEQGFSQTAALVGDVGINYTATLENLASATRKTLHNGNLINTRTITGHIYSESILQNQKGQTCFVLEASGVKPDTTCVNVPDYASVLYTGRIPNIYTNDTATTTIDSIVDRNPEDNPVIATGITSLDNIVQSNLNGNEIKVFSGDSVKPYSIGINTRTATGILNQIVLNHQVSPDQIAFSSIIPGTNGNPPLEGDQVYTIFLDGTNLRKLTSGLQNITPSWSPDGQMVAFQNSGIDYSVYISNADGSGQRRLVQNSWSIMNPSWFPDGNRLVVIYTNLSTISGLGIVNEDGTGFNEIYRAPSGNILADPRISPDGTRIAFENNGKINIINTDGTNRIVFTNDSFISGAPRWLPNGSGILFRSNNTLSGEFDFCIKYFNGNLRQINIPGSELDPDISPEGNRIIYATMGSSIFNIINLNSSNVIGTITVPGLARFPTFRPRVR